MQISDRSLSMILAALNSFQHEFISNPTLVAMTDAATAEVQAYSRSLEQQPDRLARSYRVTYVDQDDSSERDSVLSDMGDNDSRREE